MHKNTTHTPTLSGSFSNLSDAEGTVQELLDAHVPASHIYVTASCDGSIDQHQLVHQTAVAPGAALGAGVGAVVGLVGIVSSSGLLEPWTVAGVLSASCLAGLVGGALSGLSWWRKTSVPHGFDAQSPAVVTVRGRSWLHPALRVFECSGARDLTLDPDGARTTSEQSRRWEEPMEIPVPWGIERTEQEAGASSWH